MESIDSSLDVACERAEGREAVRAPPRYSVECEDGTPAARDPPEGDYGEASRDRKLYALGRGTPESFPLAPGHKGA